MNFYFDFETRSSVSIKETSIRRYVNDAHFAPLCMAWCVGNDDFKFSKTRLWQPGELFPEKLRQMMHDSSWLAFAWNIEFDAAVWNKCIKNYSFPRMPVENLRCLRAVSVSKGFPGTLDACSKILAPDHTKLKEGKRLLRALSIPKSKEGPVEFRTSESDPDDFNRLYEYAIRDVETMCKCHKRLAEINPQAGIALTKTEQNVWEQTYRINVTGTRVDTALAERLRDLIDMEKAIRTKKLSKITNGEITTPGQIARISKYLASKNIKVSTLNAQKVDELLASDVLDDDARAVLEIRKDLGRTSTSKIEAILKQHDAFRIYSPLIYHQASTGRFAGAGVQMHNLPRKQLSLDLQDFAIDTIMKDMVWEAKPVFKILYSLFGSINQIAQSLVRPCFMADTDEFVVADYASIEYAVMIWLAKDDKAVEAWKANVDTYKEMATHIYKKPIDKITSEERFYGKQAVLGCIYGMGADKFVATLESRGIPIDKQFATVVVKSFRDRYKSVVRYWNGCSAVALKAIKNPHNVIDGYKLKMVFDGKHLLVRLPSKRVIVYPYVHVKHVDNYYNNEEISFMKYANNAWFRTHLIGPKLTEHVVQGLARDVMVDGVDKIFKKHGEVRFHVHDEIVAEHITKGDMEACMTTPPKWAKDLHIKVESGTMRRYRKI